MWSVMVSQLLLCLLLLRISSWVGVARGAVFLRLQSEKAVPWAFEAAPRCLPRFAPSPEVRNDAGYGANASPRRSEPQYGPYGFDDVPATSHSSAGQPHGHPPRAAFGPHSDAVHAGSGNFDHAGTGNSWGFRTGQAQFGPPGFPVFHGMAWQPSNPWLGPYASMFSNPWLKHYPPHPMQGDWPLPQGSVPSEPSGSSRRRLLHMPSRSPPPPLPHCSEQVTMGEWRRLRCNTPDIADPVSRNMAPPASLRYGVHHFRMDPYAMRGYSFSHRVRS